MTRWVVPAMYLVQILAASYKIAYNPRFSIYGCGNSAAAIHDNWFVKILSTYIIHQHYNSVCSMYSISQDRDSVIRRRQFRFYLQVVCVNPTFISIHGYLTNLYVPVYGHHSLVTVARPYKTIRRVVLFAEVTETCVVTKFGSRAAANGYDIWKVDDLTHVEVLYFLFYL